MLGECSECVLIQIIVIFVTNVVRCRGELDYKLMLLSTLHSRYIAPFGVILLLLLSACISGRVRNPIPTDEHQILGVKDSLNPDSILLAESLGHSIDSLDTLGSSISLDSLNLVKKEDSLVQDTSSRLSGLVPDSLGSDSLNSKQGNRDPRLAGFDDIIEYKAQDSMVLLGKSMAYLFGPSTVDYKDKGMEANFMRLNLDSNQVYAHYIVDSLGNGSAYPKFKDGKESYEAKSMNYNFKSQKGFITGVVTQQGEGYVTAERSKKVDDQCMYMEGGRYTTCTNHEHPHFYLKLTRAKVRAGKNVVAGPSYLVIADVPLPIGLPFGFFPFSSTYSSGVLMPSYGEESTRGLYLKNGGYYWAINDYVNFQITGDWYSRGSWAVNMRSEYRKRYKFGGSIGIDYLVTKTGDRDVAGDYSESKDFRINWSHSQDPKANPSSSFSASVNFSTSSYNHNSLNTLYNPRVAGQNTKSSSINYSKTFVGTPLRLSASLDASQNSLDSMVSLSLPNISLSMSRIQPFKRKKRVGSERWYEKISLSYSGQFRNSINVKERQLFKTNLIKDWSNGISHNIPISASYKLLDYIDLTLSANYNERWYSYKTVVSYDAVKGDTIKSRDYGFNRAYDFGASMSINTTLYGFYQPWKMFGNKLQMIRHRITPSIGVSYTPDFGNPKWGVWKQLHYTDKEGKARTIDYNAYEGQIFGSPGRGKSASINFSLDNNIEAKIRVKGDTTETFKKVSLIDNFAVNASYNMAADSFQLSDINARINLKLPGDINLNLSGSFDPYLYGHTTDDKGNVTPHRVNKLRVLNGKGIGSLRGTGTSFSYTFNNETISKIKGFFGRKKKADSDSEQGAQEREQRKGKQNTNTDAKDTSMAEMAAQSGKSGSSSFYGQNSEEEGEVDSDGYLKTSIPWNISVNYGVNLTRMSFDPKRDEYNMGLQHSLMLSGSIQPTKNWSINMNASYDFLQKKLANLTIGISRDLHCWSLSANIIPIGPYRSYNINIGVKSSMLKDLKWDKHSYPNRAATW